MIKQLRPQDWIAGLTILGSFVLIAMDKGDSVITAILISVISFYFGRVSANGQAPKKNGEGAGARE